MNSSNRILLPDFQSEGKYLKVPMKCFVLLCFGLLIFSGNLFGAARTSSGSGNWNSTATWGGLSVPVAGDDVTISAGHTVTITANAACATINFGINGSTLTFSGAFTLNVSGAVTMPAAGNANTPITFELGAGIATIGGLFTMNGGSGNAGRRNDLTISTGTLNLNGGFTTAVDRCNVIFSGAGVLNISGAISSNTMILTAGTGTVNYAGSTAQNIWNLSYYNLGISGTAVKTYTGTALVVSNTLSVASGGTFELSGTGTPLSYTGTVSGKVLYSGAGAQTIAGATYYDLEFSGAGTKTIADLTTVTVSNNWIAGSTTTMTGSAAAVVTGSISGSGAITMGLGTISIAGNWTNNGILTPGTGTVNYNGTTQNIAGLTYYNLQTSNSGVKTLAANTIINNVLTIGASSTLDLSSFTLDLAGSGTPLVNNGTFTSSSSTVNFSNAASTNIPALNYYNLNTTGGDRILAGTGTIGIANAFTPGAGIITITGSIVNFNGSGAQTIPVFTFNDVILSGSGAKTVANASTVSVRTIEIQNGPTLDISGTGTLNITN